jgi:hypothetical protein
LRYFFRFEEYMTIPILEKTCKLTFVIAMAWSYLWLIEFATGWYGDDVPTKEVIMDKLTGTYSPEFLMMVFLGSVLPFTLAFEKVRRHLPTLFVISLLFNVGMWLERWMIVTPTLSYAYQPVAWSVLWPSIVQWAIVFGSFGWFGLLFLVFVKVFPSVSMYEVKEMVYHRRRAAIVEEQAVAYHRRTTDPQPATDSPGA